MKTSFNIFLLVVLSFFTSFNVSANDTFFSIEKSSARVCEVANAVGKTADEWLTALKGVDYQSLRHHIFNGDLRKVTGCHLRSAVDGVNIRFVNNATPNANSLGVLEGAIEMRKPLLDAQGNITGYKWVVKNTQGELQTFFPSTWSQDKILQECASALSNPNKALVPGKTRMYTGESNSGVFMKWFEDANGNVTSIFPEFN